MGRQVGSKDHASGQIDQEIDIADVVSSMVMVFIFVVPGLIGGAARVGRRQRRVVGWLGDHCRHAIPGPSDTSLTNDGIDSSSVTVVSVQTGSGQATSLRR